MNIYERLKQLRLARNWTLQQVATSIGCSVANISNLEHGRQKPNWDMLRAYTRVFQITLGELVAPCEEVPDVADPAPVS